MSIPTSKLLSNLSELSKLLAVCETHASTIDEELGDEIHTLLRKLNRVKAISVGVALDKGATATELSKSSDLSKMRFSQMKEEYAVRKELHMRHYEETVPHTLKMHLTDFFLLPSIQKSLASEKIITVRDLIGLTRAQAMAMPNIGSNNIKTLDEFLREEGLRWFK